MSSVVWLVVVMHAVGFLVMLLLQKLLDRWIFSTSNYYGNDDGIFDITRFL